MKDFGIRFAVTDQMQFERLVALIDRVKRHKAAGIRSNPELWTALVPGDVKSRFRSPDDEARKARTAAKPPIIISDPSDQLGAVWDFDRVFESIEEGDYDLMGCEMVARDTAEIRINPHGYPYGGLGPFIALAEAYGFAVIGVNECGKFQGREELIDQAGHP
ncbi:MAG TPA: hypothetical protein VFA39_05930 [Steroidobacteraceae bacterium]|nr:hypothetical protein [Steroidobacteraceae bacterium]